MAIVSLSPIDWLLAERLYLEGKPYPEIAAATGATEVNLRTRACRYWSKRRNNKCEAAATNWLSTRSKAIRERLSEEIEREMDVLSKYPPKQLVDLLGRGQGGAGLISELTATAAKIYGWDRKEPTGLVVSGDVSQLQVLQVNSAPANPLLEPVALAVPGTPATA